MKYFNKPPGKTINQFIDEIKEEYQLKKICFCGRLDPMARGQILILVEEECKDMNKYLGLNKIYHFEIILNIKTTSDDPLGIIEDLKYNYDEGIIDKVYKELKNYKKKQFYQKFHNYSSKQVEGKALWYYTKNNIPVVNPTHLVNINSIHYSDAIEYNYLEWRNMIVSQIKTIDEKKDFNQKNIIKQWENLEFGNLISIPIEIDVSSGFYVRQFVRDLSDKLNYPLLTYDINRIAMYK